MTEPDKSTKSKSKFTPSSPEEIEIRRGKLLQYMIGGITNRRILAEFLKVSPMTIQNDIKALRTQLRQDNLTTFENYSAMHLEQANTALTAIHPEVLRGNLDAIDRLISLMKHQADVIGLNGFMRDRQDKKDGAGDYKEKKDPTPINTTNLNFVGSDTDVQVAISGMLQLPPDQLTSFLANIRAVSQTLQPKEEHDD